MRRCLRSPERLLTPDFWRVERRIQPAFATASELRQPGDFAWVADFPTARDATRYVAFLGEPSCGERVSADQAAEALDSLDDYARMDLGVDAAGPRGVLERFIAQACAASE